MALETTSIMPVAPTGFGGGFGGIAPVGLIGLNSLLGGGLYGGVAPAALPVQTHVIEQTLGEIRKDIGDAKVASVQTECNIQAAIQVQDAANQVNFRALDKQLCDARHDATVAAMNGTIQGLTNTTSIKDQASANAAVAASQFSSLQATIMKDGDATRALITQNLIDGLRAELAGERRGRDQREIEITVNQSNVQTQNQVQAQLQAQTQFLATSLNSLGDQLNRQTNSIINLGTMAATGQSNSNANTKVNS